MDPDYLYDKTSLTPIMTVKKILNANSGTYLNRIYSKILDYAENDHFVQNGPTTLSITTLSIITFRITRNKMRSSA
jgi:hypothetical protein